MFATVKRSLNDLLGTAYTRSLKEVQVRLFGADEARVDALLNEKVDFFPREFEESLNEGLGAVGTQVVPSFKNEMTGAATDSFKAAMHGEMSPLGGKGFFRCGEDGRLYFIAKSEHYHVSLGHNFPGYHLVEIAKRLGIVNATHNNTRGYITRLLERELIRVANGIQKGDEKGLADILDSEDPHVLNRVINLQTGSLGVEAGMKMMLTRFYRLEESYCTPQYAGKTPVFFVMGDHAGGKSANYHGTTMLMQSMRGLWPEFCEKAGRSGLYEVVPVMINDIDDFTEKMNQYNRDGKKVAGFFHEIVLMNYGAVTLDREYLKQAYELCRKNDVPILVDEIQSCIWYKELYLFRDYGLSPDFVVIGKGFSGGEYPASKILTTKEMDNLNQFGALVTNGQEELASLAYLVTMEFALANTRETQSVGRYYQERVEALAEKHSDLILKTEGIGHLLALHFMETEQAMQFSAIMNDGCVDISAHGYKSVFLPAALTKLPLIVNREAVDFMLERMEQAIVRLEREEINA